MSHLRKLPYYDLALEHSKGRLPWLCGRTDEQAVLTSTILRPNYNNVVILGNAGVGKTTLARSWAGAAARKHTDLSWIELKIDGFEQLQTGPAGAATFIEDALDTIENSVIYIDDFGSFLYRKPQVGERVTKLLRPFLTRSDIKLVLSSDPASWLWLSEQEPQWVNRFEKLNLAEPDTITLQTILKHRVMELGSTWAMEWREGTFEKIIEACKRYSQFGSGPRSELKLLEEIFSVTALAKKRIVTIAMVENIIHERLGLPTQNSDGSSNLASKLGSLLSDKIIGQEHALGIISNTLKRSLLGLKNPQRPRASFLFLGPSGVGKTETAKVISQLLFGDSNKFLRLDMSEFSEAGTVQRLIGAPPGFIGFEQGGILTEYGKNNPYSVILLDELEKAHNKIFDIFLQLLDDGRLSSGKGEVIDFKESILVATSNCAVPEIIDAYQKNKLHDEKTVHQVIMPKLTEHFRLEFLNRFDAIIIFNPLSPDNLVAITHLEIQKMEQRLKQHRVKFNIPDSLIRQQIENGYDIRFGARPLKRWVEAQCESLLMERLLKT
jgi:ATP-dependent Clp protease ATP-binding subunit ClpC